MLGLDEYQKLAARTLIEKPDRQIPDGEMMLVWNVVGLSGETGEVCRIAGLRSPSSPRLVDEIGDVVWYLAALCTKIGRNLGDFPRRSFDLRWSDLESLALCLSAEVGTAVDMVKKGVFHQHGINPDALWYRLVEVFCILDAMCVKIGVSLDEVMQANIDKLRKRYPDGYSAEASKNR